MALIGRVGKELSSRDLYGWPLVYLDTVDDWDLRRLPPEAPEHQDRNYYMLPLAIDLFAWAAIVVGSGVTLGKLAPAIVSGLRFRIGTLLSLMFAVPMAIWVTQDREHHIWWANWFVEWTVFFGAGCAAFAAADFGFHLLGKIGRANDRQLDFEP